VSADGTAFIHGLPLWLPAFGGHGRPR
jgi:hypothetical protein